MFETLKRLIAQQPPAAPAITPAAVTPVAGVPVSKPRTVKMVTLAVPTACDAEQKTIHFTLAYASRKAEQWDVADGAIRFAFPHGASGYIVEEGNAANFAQPQHTCATLLPNGTKAVAVEARLGQFKLPYDCVSLFAFMCDTQGRVLAKTRIDIDDGFGADIVPVPVGATRMCFAWRLEGRGLIGDLSLTLERLGQKDLGAGGGSTRAKTAQAVHDSKIALSAQRPGDDDAALTAPIASAKDTQPESAAADAANLLLAERRFHAAIKMIEALEAQTDRDLKLLMRAYGGLHMFDKALEAHAKLSDKAKGEVSVLVNLLRIYANLGRIDDARDMVERRCHDLSPNKKTIEFLCMAYPFAVYISEPLADMVLARLSATPELVAKKNFNQLLRCAHDLAGTAKKYEFFKLSHALHNFELTSHDKAKLDILAAHHAWHNKRYDVMLESVNRAFVTYGAAPVVSTQPQDPDMFKHVHCPSAQAGSVDGPLVSVLMTCYAAAGSVEFALRSVMNQTYKNLEIFVIDDVSPDDGREIVKKLAAEDPRITLIQLEKNGGTYVAKNHGLQRATGTFVTCQDSDDWAHPQKIERMVKTLQDKPELIATAVQHVRYDPARGFRGRNGYIQLDAPSLCYHRAPVMERVGYYDCVRAGADTEHEYRMQRVFGRDSIQYIPDLLTLFLWSETSLTGGGAFAIDDDLGIFNKPRSGYRQAYLHWQEHADNNHYPFPLSDRLFDVPSEMKP